VLRVAEGHHKEDAAVITYRRIRLVQLGDSPVITFAVQEFVRYLKKMDAQLFVDVLTEDAVGQPRDGVIYIGRDSAWADAIPAVADPARDDAIAISVHGKSGYITGTNDRSVLLAVYRTLKALGCNWVRPGKEGERIPARAIDTIEAEICEAASSRHRGVCIEGAVSYDNVLDMIDYIPKVGMNEYFIQFLVPGCFFERWYKHQDNPLSKAEDISREDIAAMTVALEREITRRGLGYHKTGHGWTCEPFGIDGSGWNANKQYDISDEIRSYLAQIGGERALWRNVPLNTNLCYSNPTVRGKMTDAITDYCRKNPHIDILHFWLADGHNNHCECENCVKMRPADWYVTMLNELDEKLTAAGVPTKIVFLIYVDLLWEPVECRIQNPDRFILMFAPITRRFGQNYGESIVYDEELPPYTRNKLSMPNSLAQNLEHLRRWQAGFDGDSFAFDYHLWGAHLNDPGYEKAAQNLFCDMQDLKKIGLNGMVSCQIQRCFFPTALPFNMMASALWNAEGDFEAEALAYYRAAFGEDGDELHRHLAAVSDLFIMYYGPTAGEPDKLERGPYCTDYNALNDEIVAIRALVIRNAGRDDACRANWMNISYYCEYLRLFSLMLHARETGAKEEANHLCDQLIRFTREIENAVQPVLDVWRLCVHLRRRYP